MTYRFALGREDVLVAVGLTRRTGRIGLIAFTLAFGGTYLVSLK